MSTASSKRHQWKPGGYKPRPTQLAARPHLAPAPSGVQVCRACRGDGEDRDGFPCTPCNGTGEIPTHIEEPL